MKAVAVALGFPEAEEARRRGRWSLRLLDAAARRAGERNDRRIYDDWTMRTLSPCRGFPRGPA